MTRCEHCQSLILDHLYGLLDGPDAAAIEAHLRECPTCVATRDEAARVQGLFAKAARGAFPNVRFEAPGAEKPEKPVAKSPAVPTPGAAALSTPAGGGWSVRVGTWLPWAVAAAVLLAIPGTVIPVLGTLKRAETTRRAADSAAANVTTLLGEKDAAEKKIHEPRELALRDFAAKKQTAERLLARWMEEEKAALTLARKTTVDVFKPASFQPGAPNEFQLVVHDRSATLNGRLLAEIRDQTDAVIFSQKLEPDRQPAGHQTVRVPSSVWTNLTPQSELFLVVASVDDKTGSRTEIQDRIRLLGPVYATMLVTDKPTYRPGETVYFRSLTLDRTSFRPPARDLFLRYELYQQRHGKRASVSQTLHGGTDLVRITDGQVAPITGPDGQPLRGVGCGAFALPPDAPEGDYTLQLQELPHPAGYPPTVPQPVTRAIKVRVGTPDVFLKEADFSKASYAPGNTVEGWAKLSLDGRPVAGAEVSAVATADDLVLNEVTVTPRVTGPDGRVNLHFTLPPDLDRGDVKLRVQYKAKVGGKEVPESLAKRVPVVGHRVQVEFFPEGGTHVAGVPCRIYFRATTPAGQPVDIKGTLTDGRRTLAKVETLTGDPALGANRGIGSFTYTPTLGTPVWLKLDEPRNMSAPLLVPDEKDFPVAAAAAVGFPATLAARTGFELPTPAIEGVVMTIPDAVTVPGQPIRVHLRSVGKSRNLVVGAYTRGRLADTPQRRTVEPDQLVEVQLMTKPDPRGGVVRVTVFEEPEEGDAIEGVKPDLKPVAERLVFRKPGEGLNLSYTTSSASASTARGFTPGSTVDLNITALDEKGNPTTAILYAATVNAGVASGPTDRLLTTHFLIAGEINTPDAMEHADFLLTDHPKAPEVLDLVLATQGWRRFAEQTPPGYIQRLDAPTPERAGLLVTTGQYATWTDPATLREQRRIHETYSVRFETAEKAQRVAEEVLKAATIDHAAEARARELTAKVEDAREEARVRAERAQDAAAPVARFQRAGWYGVVGFGFLAVLLGFVALARPASRLPLGISTVGSLGLVAFLVFALGMTEQTQASPPLVTAQSEPQVAARSDDTAPAKAEMATPAASVSPQADGPVTLNMQAQMATPLSQPGGGGAPGQPSGNSFGPQSTLPAPIPTPGMGGGGVGGGKAGFGSGPKSRAKVGGGPPLPVQPPVLPKVEPGRVAMGGATTPTPPPKPVAPPPKEVLPEPKSEPKKDARPPAAGGVESMAKPSALLPQPPTPVPAPGGPRGIPPSLDAEWRKRYGDPLITNDDLERNKGVSQSRRKVMDMVALGANAPADRMHTDLFSRDAELVRLYAESRMKTVTEQIDRTVSRTMAGRMNAPPGAPPGPGPAQSGNFFAMAPMDMQALNRVKESLRPVTPLVVREYAPARPGTFDAEAGSPDTILWQPVIVLPSDGKTKLTCTIGSAHGYQVLIAGHTLDGRIGAVRGVIPVAANEPTLQTEPAPQTGRPAPIPPKAP